MKASGADRLTAPVGIESTAVIGDECRMANESWRASTTSSKIADCTGLDGFGEWSIGPHDIAAGHHESPDEVGTGEIVMAADGDDGPSQQHAHVLNQPRLPAPGRAGEHDG
jgi:hypothetical protein